MIDGKNPSSAISAICLEDPKSVPLIALLVAKSAPIITRFSPNLPIISLAPEARAYSLFLIKSSKGIAKTAPRAMIKYINDTNITAKYMALGILISGLLVSLTALITS